MPIWKIGLDWITFSTSHQLGWIECFLNIPGLKYISKQINSSKHYPVEKPSNEISSLESTDTFQS